MPPNLVAIMKRNGKQPLDRCCKGKFIVLTAASKCLAYPKGQFDSHLPCADSDSFRIQYLPEQEKGRVQDFRNWVESDLDSSTRLGPDSPIIGLIKSYDAATCQEVGTSGMPKESAPEAEKSAPSGKQAPPSAGASDGATAIAAATSGGEGGGSGRPRVPVVPFQSLPSSSQEELGKELFDDPLLTLENIQKLADYIQWSFKFTKVCLLPSILLYIE